MYQAFDDFLSTGTWHTMHDLDGACFYRALDQVVRNEEFSPDAMAAYMRSKVGILPNAQGYFVNAIDRYMTAAWAVRDYLAATKAI